jgi:hypothetical protein
MEERWCGMKKNDWILAAAIFFVAVLTFGLQLLKTTDKYGIYGANARINSWRPQINTAKWRFW